MTDLQTAIASAREALTYHGNQPNHKAALRNLVAALDAQAPPAAVPSPNWCPDCGRRPHDPFAVLGCRHKFHSAELTQRKEGE